MQEFARLVDIVATLRSPDGCPWDREQTIDSLKPFVLEETYEVLEAIDRHDHVALREELGDFLFEAVFVAQLEAEAGHFTVADALTSIADKLVRRHPHVFAPRGGERGAQAATKSSRAGNRSRRRNAAARPNRRRCSAASRRRCPPCFGRTRSACAPGRSASTGRGPPTSWTRSRRRSTNCGRWSHGSAPTDHARAEEEMGDLLFSIANLSRQLGIEPETALRKANDKFTTALRDDGTVRRASRPDDGRHEPGGTGTGVATG